MLYAQCMNCFPNVVQKLTAPQMFQSPSPASSFAFQTPTNTSWTQCTTIPPEKASTCQTWTQPQASTLPPDATAFFRTPWRFDGCIFCVQQGHVVHECIIAFEYVKNGCAKVHEGRLHLPNGQAIPNDSSGHGLKSSIDAWIAANVLPAPDPAPAPTSQAPAPSQ